MYHTPRALVVDPVYIAVGSWLQVECPTPVRIWKIPLGGREIKRMEVMMGALG